MNAIMLGLGYASLVIGVLGIAAVMVLSSLKFARTI